MSGLYISKADFLYYSRRNYGMTPDQAADAWTIKRDQQQKEKALRRALRQEAGLAPTCRSFLVDQYGEATGRPTH